MSWNGRAAVYVETDVLEFRQEKVAVSQPDDVVLKVVACGVCGTDLHLFHGEIPLARPPVVLGHEIFAEVVEVGPGVDDLRPGQRVAVDPVIPCGRCEFCQSGRPNLCPHQRNMGYHVAGGYCQYTKASRDRLYPLSQSVGLKGGILVETLACVVRGYDRLQPAAGSRVLVVGAGTVGLLWAQLLQGAEACEVVQVDLVPERAEVARKLGAHHALAVEEGKLRECLGPLAQGGFDVVIDATGNPRAVEEGIELVRPGGKMMVFGVCPEHATVRVRPYKLFVDEISILSSKMPPYAFPEAVRLIEAGKIDAETIVSHVLPLADLPEAFALFEKGKDKALKIAIDPWA
ncbi:MAG: alcohol dehydrogenase catalytic domain-containing protein [candidate division KSB1 bacterium]|nr:alcohol dehydrogenase catalytic domain-containing protein [candidate division KSB1 bacterium]